MRIKSSKKEKSGQSEQENTKLKKNLRKEFFEYSKKFSVKEKESANKVLYHKTTRWLLKRKNRSLKILAYAPFSSEPPVLDILNLESVELFLPEVRGDKMIPRSLKTGKPVSHHTLDFVVVPCLFFNKSGYRLGRGGGYYDRFLRFVPRFSTLVIGYEWQLKDDLPVDDWDIPVGRWISDKSSGLCYQKNTLNLEKP